MAGFHELKYIPSTIGLFGLTPKVRREKTAFKDSIPVSLKDTSLTSPIT